MNLIISWSYLISSYLLSPSRPLQTLFNPPLNILSCDLNVKRPHRKVCWNTWSPTVMLLWKIREPERSGSLEPWLCRLAPVPTCSLIPMLLGYQQYFYIYYSLLCNINLFFYVLLIYSTNLKSFNHSRVYFIFHFSVYSFMIFIKKNLKGKKF